MGDICSRCAIRIDPQTYKNPLYIDAYPDADFAGLYGHEESLDPVCVQSRTGFVINMASCPVFGKLSYKLKLQPPQWNPRLSRLLLVAES